MSKNKTQKKPLGQILVNQGLVTEDQLRIALREQLKTNQPVGKLLVSLGFVTESTLREVLSESLGKRSIDLSNSVVDPEALKLLPQEVAKRYRMLPLDLDKNSRKLTLATSDVNDIVALDKVKSVLPADLEIETVLVGDQEINQALDQYYEYQLSIDGILYEIETGEIDLRSVQTSEEYSQPVVRLINAILTDAVKKEASDIHLEPEANFLRIRYRIDGILRQARAIHKSYWSAMAVRVKVMSAMNIAETRAPQDGRFSLTISGRQVDFRVSSHPTVFGENIVLRILDRTRGVLTLEAMNLPQQALDITRLMLARPEGLILVTGPTGSGKTTTLYSLLNHINSEGINIMTLEDPVEYPMPLIRQTTVSEAIKLDFANGIRSLMRQDPDVILVGEIRDADTAEMAFRAAMTGHQVFATLHTNSALGAIPRLIDVGVSQNIIVGNIIGIIAQRLVRKLCPHCKQPYEADPITMKLLQIPEEQTPPTLYLPDGCNKCDFLGYKGRFSIMELFRITPEIDEYLARRATAKELLDQAEKEGFVSLQVNGLARVLDGTTSLEEIGRSINLTHLM